MNHSEPHLACSMAGSAMWYVTVRTVGKIFAVSARYNFGRNGMHIVMCLDRLARDKMGDGCERFNFSQQSASNDHYIE